MFDSRENTALAKALESARRVVKEDPELAVFMVRDFEELKEWQLDDLAWALYQDDYLTRNDAIGLLDMIAERLQPNV